MKVTPEFAKMVSDDEMIHGEEFKRMLSRAKKFKRIPQNKPMNEMSTTTRDSGEKSPVRSFLLR